MKKSFVIGTIAAAVLGIGLRAQETNQDKAGRERMEVVRSNMVARVQEQRARAATNRSVLVSNENSFVISTPRPPVIHKINTNFFLEHPEEMERARQILV